MFLQNKKDFIDSNQVEKNEWKFYIDNISEGYTVFDIGANIGELTTIFSKFCGSSGQVHSFEPTPNTYKRLVNSVNNLNIQNCLANNMAVSNKTGTINFNIYEDRYASWNTIANRPLEKYGINIENPLSIEVKSITVDDYCNQNDIKYIDLLKIDVEGAELDVLNGCERMFMQKKIKLCVFEFGQTIFDMGTTIEEIKSFFSKVRYEVRNISQGQQLYPVDKKTNIAQFSVLCAKQAR